MVHCEACGRPLVGKKRGAKYHNEVCRWQARRVQISASKDFWRRVGAIQRPARSEGRRSVPSGVSRDG